MTDTPSPQARIDQLRQGPGHDVERAELQSWMRSEDLDVQLALFWLLRDKQHLLNVQPPLDDREYVRFRRTFLARVMSGPVDLLAGLTQHGAAYEVAGWFVALLDNGASRRVLDEFRDWLGELYRSGDEAMRGVLVTGALEHLFERRDIQKLFAEWKNDEVLRQAFEEAALWRKHGGDSPIVGRKKPKKKRVTKPGA